MPTTHPGLPLFYQRPRVLMPTAHAGCGIELVTDFGFAAMTNSVPIGAEEFFEAQAYCPIVFTATDPIIPVAVLGFEAGRNLFVEADGKWRPGTYIPAYVRRYPFVFITAGEDNFVLGVDEGAGSFSRAGGQPLFEGGEPSPMTKRALDFCSAFQVQDRIAREFAAALKANDLLVPQQANVRSGPGQSAKSLAGFNAIEEARLAALPDEVLLDWHKRNWLGLVYAHLLSQRRWTDLANLLRESAAV